MRSQLLWRSRRVEVKNQKDRNRTGFELFDSDWIVAMHCGRAALMGVHSQQHWDVYLKRQTLIFIS